MDTTMVGGAGVGGGEAGEGAELALYKRTQRRSRTGE
jgi:hypothetical protein